MKPYEHNEELVYKVQHGDKQAMEDLVKANQPLIYSLARKHLNKRLELEDLVQEGCLGFVKAVYNFDMEDNPDIKLVTYAVPHIEGRIRRYIRDNYFIHANRDTRTLIMRVQGIRDLLKKELFREPTRQEIAEFLNVDEKKIGEAFLLSIKFSLQYTLNERNVVSDWIYLEDTISSKDNVENSVIKLDIESIVESMPKYLKDVYKCRYIEDMKQREIAEKLNISQSEVSRCISYITKLFSIKLGMPINKTPKQRNGIYKSIIKYLDNCKFEDTLEFKKDIAEKFGVKLGTAKTYISQWKNQGDKVCI